MKARGAVGIGLSVQGVPKMSMIQRDRGNKSRTVGASKKEREEVNMKVNTHAWAGRRRGDDCTTMFKEMGAVDM